MSEKETTHGLSCPNCGGMVPIPGGQVIVICPYCELRSMVRGERGLQRFQVPMRIDREQALAALRQFFGQNRAVATDAARRATLQEAFAVYLPFWTVWARVLGWVFGQKRVSDGDSHRYEPREVEFTQDANWNSAACDIGEFGVETVLLQGQPLEAFNPDALHARGMVFEPVGSVSEARRAAEDEFKGRVSRAAGLDRVAQTFVRFVRQRMGLVYYPMWVVRYLYRGRSFQVVVDGYTGQVLYGKAPGNTLYRAAVLIGGMALGALLAVDGSALALTIAFNLSDNGVGFFLLLALGALVAGLGLMLGSFRTFRFGEQFEYRRSGGKPALGFFDTKEIISTMEDLEPWLSRLS